MTAYQTQAQNSYPTSGDALIHGLTIGTGPGGTAAVTNTALGASALMSNTGGGYNVAVGLNTLSNNTGGGYNSGTGNTAIGANSMYFNTEGFYNTAVGYNSLNSNTSGAGNVAFGLGALGLNSTGSSNVAMGLAALQYNSAGNNNVGIGNYALNSSGGTSNVAVGDFALQSSTTASNLVAVGDSALLNNSASYNTAIGSKTLLSTTSGAANTALGFQVLYNNTTGYGNVASGVSTLYTNGSGNYNSAFGHEALYANSSGSDNSASGSYALFINTTGTLNTAMGMLALESNTTGSDNTAVGAYANVTSGALTNATAVGYNASVNASNKVVIGNSSVTSIGGYAGWTNFSDGRYKKNINRNVPGLVFINKLVPITYTLDIDGIEARQKQTTTATRSPSGAATTATSPTPTVPSLSDDPILKQAMKEKSAVVYTGFVAQDVDQAARSIGYNFSGVDKPKDDQQSFYGLRYSDFVVPLVKAVQELSAQNDSLQQANAQLSQRLDVVEQILGINPAPASATSTTPLTFDLSSARLFQNNPNPFNQTTLINYYLPQNAGPSYIQITGTNGQTIKSIALTATGIGQISIQTPTLAAGTYMYSLVVNGTVIDTKKMVLVK